MIVPMLKLVRGMNTHTTRSLLFLDARYVSAPEGFWRLSEYHLHEQSHAIVRLPVHLQQQHVVHFREGSKDQALESASRKDTMLTTWFKLNTESEDARQFLYTDVPNHDVFDRKKKEWKARKRGGKKIIARMYSVSVKDIEWFCLRLLLLHIPGAASFSDLCNVKGIMDSHKHKIFHLASYLFLPTVSHTHTFFC